MDDVTERVRSTLEEHRPVGLLTNDSGRFIVICECDEACGGEDDIAAYEQHRAHQAEMVVQALGLQQVGTRCRFDRQFVRGMSDG